MDVVMQCAWTALAVAAVLLVLRPRGGRGLWWFVASACVVIALDKAIDVQTFVFHSAKELTGELLAAVGLAEARKRVKVAMLLAATIVGLAALLWLVRRDRAIDRAKLLACTGLALVMALVGIRAVPGLDRLADPRAGWVVEAIACSCVAAGLWGGFRRSPPSADRGAGPAAS